MQSMLDIEGAPSHPWRQVKRTDIRSRDLADRHYSRQTPGAVGFMASGRTFVLLAEFESLPGPQPSTSYATWGAIENLDPVGTRRFRVAIYRNETPWLSSLLITSATTLTIERWARRGWLAACPPLSTEVDPRNTRRKRDPGRCFVRAGWERWSVQRGLVVLLAPGERERCNLQGPAMK